MRSCHIIEGETIRTVNVIIKSCYLLFQIAVLKAGQLQTFDLIIIFTPER